MFGKISCCFLLLTAVFAGGYTLVYGAPTAEKKSQPLQTSTIVETQRVPFEGDGFSIKLPVGWVSQRKDMPKFTVFTCAEPGKRVETKLQTSITVMFGKREKEHDDDFLANVLKGIAASDIIERGTFNALKNKEKIEGEWIHYLQHLKDGSSGHVTVYLLTDSVTAYIILCFAPKAQYETYKDMFREVGGSLVIK
ncbi:hypothetical protein LLG96_12140 [bacterium]|nr:hypothetical protein [bacterium]